MSEIDNRKSASFLGGQLPSRNVNLLTVLSAHCAGLRAALKITPRKNGAGSVDPFGLANERKVPKSLAIREGAVVSG